jgi:hypothetical protein
VVNLAGFIFVSRAEFSSPSLVSRHFITSFTL